MGISNDLLEKYATGSCTVDERRLVEEWLNNQQVPEISLSDDDKALAGERIWKSIDAQIGQARIRSLRYYFSAAATVVLVCAMMLIWQGRQRQNTAITAGAYVELGGKKKVAEYGGMLFTLAGDSQAKMKLSQGTAGNIVFCGLMEVKNTSNRDVPYVFESECQNSAYTKKQVLMKAGKTYIVLHNFFKKDEILIVNRENLAGLPDAVTAKISEQLSI